ncbi:MAG: hypothetical protein COA67_00075 [Lutibacter sp.]|nr:MAG: hypothetical protein COA67_00075 [Lutibacter sp.]
MIKDFLISFKDNIKKKTSNPFLGTYAIVWVIRNWELVYSLFQFDSDTNRIKRIEIIKAYYLDRNFIYDLLFNVLWAFGVLILTFALINLSRLIINFFEKIVTPKIYEITDKNSVVLKETYNQLKSEMDILESKLEKERENKSKLQIEITRLEERDSKIQIESLSGGNTNKSKEGTIVKQTKEKKISTIESFEIDNLANQILKNNKLGSGLSTITYYIQGGYSNLSTAEDMSIDVLSFFESNDLIENIGKGMYQWTRKGKEVNKIITRSKF